MASLLSQPLERYSITIQTCLIIMGFEFAHWLGFNFSNFYLFLIVVILLFGIISNSIVTLMALPLMGILLQQQDGVLHAFHPVWIKGTQSWIRLQLQHPLFNSRLQALCNALVLGDTKGIGYQQKLLFKELSIIHVIAISGMHLQIINFYIKIPLFITAKYVKTNRLISLMTLWTFALIANSNPSIIRACAQYHYTTIGTIQHRRIIAINKIAASLLIILFLYSSLLHNVGFQLSIAAIIGIQFIYPLIYNRLKFENILIQKLWQSICISISAQIMCMPLIALYMGTIYTQFLISNLLLSPLFTVLLHQIIWLLLTNSLPVIRDLIATSIAKNHECINTISHHLFQKLPHSPINAHFDISLLVYTYASYLICIIWIHKKQPKMLVWLLLLTCLLRISQCAQAGIK